MNRLIKLVLALLLISTPAMAQTVGQGAPASDARSWPIHVTFGGSAIDPRLVTVQNTALNVRVFDQGGAGIDSTSNSLNVHVTNEALAAQQWGTWNFRLFDQSGVGINSTSNAINTYVTNATLAATQSGTWNIGTLATITNPVTVTDGAGALNVIVDSGTVTAVTSITNPVDVKDTNGNAINSVTAAPTDTTRGVVTREARELVSATHSFTTNDEIFDVDVTGAASLTFAFTAFDATDAASIGASTDGVTFYAVSPFYDTGGGGWTAGSSAIDVSTSGYLYRLDVQGFTTVRFVGEDIAGVGNPVAITLSAQLSRDSFVPVLTQTTITTGGGSLEVTVDNTNSAPVYVEPRQPATLSCSVGFPTSGTCDLSVGSQLVTLNFSSGYSGTITPTCGGGAVSVFNGVTGAITTTITSFPFVGYINSIGAACHFAVSGMSGSGSYLIKGYVLSPASVVANVALNGLTPSTGNGTTNASQTQRVTIASDSTGNIGLNAGNNNIGDVDIVTVPAPLSTTGGGTEATALRVTVATDSTGVLSVDDNGGSLTTDTADATASGTLQTGTSTVTLSGLNGVNVVSVQAGSSASMNTIVFQGSVDGSSWSNVSCFVQGGTSGSFVTSFSSLSGNNYSCPVGGLSAFRLAVNSGSWSGAGTEAIALRATHAGNPQAVITRSLTAATDTVTVTDGAGALNTILDSGTVTSITNALPAGTNLLGKVGIDQTTPGTTNAVQANAGTDLNTSALALESGNLASILTQLLTLAATIGTGNETAPSTMMMIGGIDGLGRSQVLSAPTGVLQVQPLSQNLRLPCNRLRRTNCF